MKFCCECGSTIKTEIPSGDNRERFVCLSCGLIHYQNPKIVTGCIPEWENKILLCKRAIEPRYGLWTLPAGFMENDETNMEGASREAKEEANAEMCDMQLYTVFSIPHINQIYTIYRGLLHKGQASTGEESLDVKLVEEKDMPWDELAFPVVIETLKLYYEDKKENNFNTHYGEIIKHDDNSYEVKRYT